MLKNGSGFQMKCHTVLKNKIKNTLCNYKTIPATRLKILSLPLATSTEFYSLLVGAWGADLTR